MPSDKYSITSSVNDSSRGHFGLEQTMLRIQILKHKLQFNLRHVRYLRVTVPVVRK